ncbi:MAG: P-II family nitrogen regulator [Erysipelothrix sp.]|nr:P-II family nitrogen regulator [Erysipelothrix sp.]
MQALILVLNKVELLEDILAAMSKAGVSGATILDSQGMGSAIVSGKQDVPMFGSLKAFFDREHPYNKTLFTIVENEEKLQNAIDAIISVAGRLENANEGLMFTVPVGQVIGLRKTD